MRIATWIALVLALAASPSMAKPAAQPAGLKLERVVLLMRHGIRPPTKATVTPPGIASQPWPAWDAPWGHLTAHGAKAVIELARYDRAVWAGRDLLPARGCPEAGQMEIWADSDQRTIATGEAMSEGLFPGCNLTAGHFEQGKLDPLFSPLDHPGSLDAEAAKAAIRTEGGDPERILKAHRAEVDLMQRVLGCCAAPACAEAGLSADCRLHDMPSAIVMPKDDGRPEATGPMDFLPTAAQSLMLAYVEGKPLAEVGWGRTSKRDIERMMVLHALKGRLLQRPAYIAARGATPLAWRMLEAMSPGPAAARVTVLVGHDTNIVHLGGMLGLHWRVAGYPADNPPPAGGIGFEVLQDAKGARFVRAFYRSQTMDQMRFLTRLDAAHPAYRQVVAIPGCTALGVDGLCTLAQFSSLVKSRMREGAS